MQSDAGYRAARMFASILFAYSSIAQKNEEGIDDPSMISKRMDSSRETALHRSHPLIPDVLLGAFFFLYALERQVTESNCDQKHMPMPADPAPALMVIQSQFLLQLLVSLLDPETFMKETNHLQGRHVLGHIAKEVPEFIFSPSFFLLSMISQTSS